MNLEAQIELITAPQEFTRLCNAVFAAEHGDDFLPIDDDRADRGNDGYLKSAKRVVALHCFKRAQNKGIDAAIRRKMLGDLGKTKTLKEQGLWEVQEEAFGAPGSPGEQVPIEHFATRIVKTYEEILDWAASFAPLRVRTFSGRH
jgi:hypothetical protein